MAMNNNEIINQIKASLDIADIIGERVKLRHASRGYMGLCPFHQEDTPSFHVYTDTQSYYCFGCHEAGDIFSYVMKTDGLAFPEALRVLADRAGVKLDAHRRESIDSRKVLDIAAKFFTASLMDSRAARAYISTRNLTEDDITRYSLGYSLNSWDSLTLHLRKMGISDKAILDSGLALSNDRGLYDRFRGRLMFPIRDITGKIIAFGGRLIDGEGAKYINSPEGQLYSKRRNLYLMDTARKFIREKDRSILVEGYMDALRLHKCGFTESVASLGTSLTAEQAELLSRYSDRCYICYDSDSAGQNAAIKGMYTLAEHGLSVYVVSIPDGKDPDEFLSSNPAGSFEKALSSAKPLILKHIEFLRPALSSERTRRRAIAELFEDLQRLNPDDVLRYTGSICSAAMLSPEAVNSLLLKKTVNDSPAPTPKIEVRTAGKNDDMEAAMCYLLMSSPECRASMSLSDAVSLLSADIAQMTAAAVLTENTDGLEASWLASEDTAKTSLLKRGEIVCSQMEGMTLDEMFVKVYSALKLGSIEKRIAEIRSMPPAQQSMDELNALFRQRTLYSR